MRVWKKNKKRNTIMRPYGGGCVFSPLLFATIILIIIVVGGRGRWVTQNAQNQKLHILNNVHIVCMFDSVCVPVSVVVDLINNRVFTARIRALFNMFFSLSFFFFVHIFGIFRLRVWIMWDNSIAREISLLIALVRSNWPYLLSRS